MLSLDHSLQYNTVACSLINLHPFRLHWSHKAMKGGPKPVVLGDMIAHLIEHVTKSSDESPDDGEISR